MMKFNKRLIFLLILLVLCGSLASSAYAADPIPGINIDIGASDNPQGASSAVTIVLLITILSIAPAILILMTSFTRIVIVLGFVRTSLGTQQMPPNQMLIGLALFLTFFIMAPTLGDINQTAVQPYLKGELTQTAALEKASVSIKKFMFQHTREKDLKLFLDYTKAPRPSGVEDTPITALVPAYAISELKTAFQMGFMIFIPFLVIDMVIASTLMAMGMMMLPPVMISLPFKILLFILVDGWYLVVRSLLLSYNT
ncbi:flagellar biosynthetic protein FliP [Paenibacillus tianmuensis]|uniref:Flagellar biosynthetic protein FliP n=1 Tax=Paenibacillus tianmuensis TaxID=624147 RepID=A0A1G4QDH2_9BACL|nr:flagellar type III secretion system pore protein FliP [Paenibacillus tianmuensis]SCW42683.1 flagellar biosynthetic protein FliP [Paenibacillus tianmuensis]